MQLISLLGVVETVLLELVTIGAKKWCPLQYTVDIALYCGFLLSLSGLHLSTYHRNYLSMPADGSVMYHVLVFFRSVAGLIEEKSHNVL